MGRWSIRARCLTPLAWLGITSACGIDKLLTSPDAARAQLQFTGEPRNTLRNESMAPAVKVSVLGPNGAPVTDFAGNVTVRLDLNPTGAALTGTLTRPVVGGVATFSDLSIDQPGDGYRLAAAADAVGSTVSVSFRIQDDRTLQLQAIAGDGQTDSVGARLAQDYIVVAQDGSGSPIVGRAIRWSADLGAIAPSSSITDSAGRASASRSLGSAVGSQTAIATLDSGLQPSVTFEATATAAAPAVLAFVVQPGLTLVGSPITPPVAVRIADRYGNSAVQFTGAIAIELAINPGGATLRGSVSRPAVNGVATYSDLTIDQAGNGYTLRATAGSLDPVSSAPFAVVPSAQSLSLSYRQQPTDEVAQSTIHPAVAVEIRDPSNNLVTAFNDTITIGIAPNTGPASARLSGKTSQPARSGVAVFGNLSIDKPGSGYRLRARSSFGFRDSNRFTIKKK